LETGTPGDAERLTNTCHQWQQIMHNCLLFSCMQAFRLSVKALARKLSLVGRQEDKHLFSKSHGQYEPSEAARIFRSSYCPAIILLDTAPAPTRLRKPNSAAQLLRSAVQARTIVTSPPQAVCSRMSSKPCVELHLLQWGHGAKKRILTLSC
jgi:hypothetical protein